MPDFDNTPLQLATYDALRELCEKVLDPVSSVWGPMDLTYGHASLSLTKHIKSDIWPKGDQHAGHELNRQGHLICERLGQSVDFIIKGVSSLEVALWMYDRTEFDRLYYFGRDLPIHVSVGPERSETVVALKRSTAGRRMPRVVWHRVGLADVGF